MTTQRTYTLLVVWLVLLLAPGALVLFGAFGHVDINTNITGPLIAAWILGYLAQFGAFMCLMALVPRQNILWWFVASLLPWAIDWTVPVSPLFMLAWVAIAAAVALWIASTSRSESTLREHGIHATGTVLKVYQPMMNVVINNVYIKRKLRLRVQRADGMPAYESDVSGLFMIGNIPSVGDRLPLVVDPEKPERIEICDQDASSDDTSAGAPSQASGGAGGIADQLKELANLHAQGSLTDDEFDAAKRKLLSS